MSLINIYRHHFEDCGAGDSNCEQNLFVNFKMKVKQGLGCEFVEEVKKLLPETRAYEGCLALYFVESQSEQGGFEFFSKWTSKKHYKQYLKFRSESGVLTEIANKYFVPDSSPVWKFFNIQSDY